jgi:hypothetical protein
VRQSLKLWEKFAENYTSMMVDAMQQTMKQSESFQRQMNEAVEQVMKPWWLMGFPAPTAPKAKENESVPSATATQTQILQTLAALQAQISILSDKVSDLETQLREKA